MKFCPPLAAYFKTIFQILFSGGGIRFTAVIHLNDLSLGQYLSAQPNYQQMIYLTFLSGAVQTGFTYTETEIVFA